MSRTVRRKLLPWNFAASRSFTLEQPLIGAAAADTVGVVAEHCGPRRLPLVAPAGTRRPIELARPTALQLSEADPATRHRVRLLDLRLNLVHSTVVRLVILLHRRRHVRLETTHTLNNLFL